MKAQTRQFNPSAGRLESAHASVRLFIYPMLCADGIIRIFVFPYLSHDGNYEYDKEDRLTQYTIPAFNTQSASTIGFSYDGVGNRLTDNRDANPNTWEYDNRDRLKKRGKLNYAYDDNGSLISIAHTDSGLQKSFVYNLDNRLTEVKDGAGNTIATYQYDPFGRRISKTSSGTTTYFFYSQEGLVAEMDSAGSIQTQYGYRPHGTWGTNPLFIKQGGYTGYYQNDQLGTPQQVVTASGQVIWDAHYSAFGKATVTSSVITNNLRLAGQYFDVETGLHYNYFRYYDPEIGRYITNDPVGLAGGINGYAYVGSNPARFIDPMGEFAWGVVFAVVDLGIQLYQNGGDLGCVNWGQVGLSALGGGVFNAFKVAKIHKFNKGSNKWQATRKWYGKNINKSIPKGEHVHHWLVDRRHFEGNPALEKIFNQPWNLNPKPFSNLYHNTKIHNNGLVGRLNGTPTWVREVSAGGGVAGGAGGGSNCGCN